MELHCEFKMEVGFNIKLTDKEYKEYKEWIKKHPNEIPVDFEDIKDCIFDGLGDIESKRIIKFSDKKHCIVEK